MHTRLLVLVSLAAVVLAGCTASGAMPANFTLEPRAVGWYAGEEAHFVLQIEPSVVQKQPEFVLDRHFAIEEIRFEESGAKLGGDYKTRDPDSVQLRLVQDGVDVDEAVLSADHPRVDLYVTLPTDLRDSAYTLELELFQVGWVKSELFRVDRPADGGAATT